MSIEYDDLENMREATSKALLAVVWIHVPIGVLIGLLRGAEWIMPAALMAAMALAAATLSWRAARNALSTRLVFAVALMGDVSLLVYQLAGHSRQIRHVHVFLCGARPSGGLLRLPADHRGHGRITSCST